LRLFFCVFVAFVCSVFVLLFYFDLAFYLGLRFCLFSFVFCDLNVCLSSHVAKLSSFDPFQAFSSLEDLIKDHLVDGGSACLIKRKIVDKISKLGQVWRGPAKWSLRMSPAGSNIDA
jgi:hypothetical protein